ncbi:hypothetical protein LBMAG10_09570 [Actinomycetes bacterium]|nr:hypothetical protein LBMAG10_09570 [Actinomycetes bacterium]
MRLDPATCTNGFVLVIATPEWNRSVGMDGRDGQGGQGGFAVQPGAQGALRSVSVRR